MLLLQDYSVRSGKGDFIIALFMSMEFTNPFLSMAITLKTVSTCIIKSPLHSVYGVYVAKRKAISTVDKLSSRLCILYNVCI